MILSKDHQVMTMTAKTVVWFELFVHIIFVLCNCICSNKHSCDVNYLLDLNLQPEVV